MDNNAECLNANQKMIYLDPRIMQIMNVYFCKTKIEVEWLSTWQQHTYNLREKTTKQAWFLLHFSILYTSSQGVFRQAFYPRIDSLKLLKLHPKCWLHMEISLQGVGDGILGIISNFFVCFLIETR